MGIFFEKSDEGRYWHIKCKMSFKQSLIFPIFYFVIIPLMYHVFKFNNTISILLGFSVFLLFLFAGILGIEGVYYGYFVPNSYKKQGKKVERKKGAGIKIYK